MKCVAHFVLQIWAAIPQFSGCTNDWPAQLPTSIKYVIPRSEFTGRWHNFYRLNLIQNDKLANRPLFALPRMGSRPAENDFGFLPESWTELEVKWDMAHPAVKVPFQPVAPADSAILHPAVEAYHDFAAALRERQTQYAPKKYSGESSHYPATCQGGYRRA